MGIKSETIEEIRARVLRTEPKLSRDDIQSQIRKAYKEISRDSNRVIGLCGGLGYGKTVLTKLEDKALPESVLLSLWDMGYDSIAKENYEWFILVDLSNAMYESGYETLYFDAALDACNQADLLNRRRRGRSDKTELMDVVKDISGAIAPISRASNIIGAIRTSRKFIIEQTREHDKILRAIREKDRSDLEFLRDCLKLDISGTKAAFIIDGLDLSRPGKPDIQNRIAQALAPLLSTPNCLWLITAESKDNSLLDIDEWITVPLLNETEAKELISERIAYLGDKILPLSEHEIQEYLESGAELTPANIVHWTDSHLADTAKALCNKLWSIGFWKDKQELEDEYGFTKAELDEYDYLLGGIAEYMTDRWVYTGEGFGTPDLTLMERSLTEAIKREGYTPQSIEVSYSYNDIVIDREPPKIQNPQVRTRLFEYISKYNGKNDFLQKCYDAEPGIKLMRRVNAYATLLKK